MSFLILQFVIFISNIFAFDYQLTVNSFIASDFIRLGNDQNLDWRISNDKKIVLFLVKNRRDFPIHSLRDSNVKPTTQKKHFIDINKRQVQQIQMKYEFADYVLEAYIYSSYQVSDLMLSKILKAIELIKSDRQPAADDTATESLGEDLKNHDCKTVPKETSSASSKILWGCLNGVMAPFQILKLFYLGIVGAPSAIGAAWNFAQDPKKSLSDFSTQLINSLKKQAAEIWNCSSTADILAGVCNILVGGAVTGGLVKLLVKAFRGEGLSSAESNLLINFFNKKSANKIKLEQPNLRGASEYKPGLFVKSVKLTDEETKIAILDASGRELSSVSYVTKGSKANVEYMETLPGIRGQGYGSEAFSMFVKKNPKIKVIDGTLSMTNRGVVQDFLKQGMSCEDSIRQSPAFKLRSKYGFTKILSAVCGPQDFSLSVGK